MIRHITRRRVGLFTLVLIGLALVAWPTWAQYQVYQQRSLWTDKESYTMRGEFGHALDASPQAGTWGYNTSSSLTRRAYSPRHTQLHHSSAVPSAPRGSRSVGAYQARAQRAGNLDYARTTAQIHRSQYHVPQRRSTLQGSMRQYTTNPARRRSQW